jgi:hypothetical protein
MMLTRMSGLCTLFTRWPMPWMLTPFFFISSTNASGARPRSTAPENIRAASSIAPPKRGPIVSMPLTIEDTRSLPARVATIVLWAPDTAGP